MKPAPLILASVLAAGPAAAAVTLANLGTTAPTGSDTGNLGPFLQRYSFDGPVSPATSPTDSHGQSFTTATSGSLQYLDIAYNAGGLGSFTVFIDNNYTGGGQAEATGAGVPSFTINIADFVPAGLSGTSADTNASPVYWFRLDLSSEMIALTSGQQAAFFLRAVSEVASDSGFVFAPHYSTTNLYAGGAALAGTNFGAPVGGANADFGFAVSVIPEPSGALLASIAPLLLLKRGRR